MTEVSRLDALYEFDKTHIDSLRHRIAVLEHDQAVIARTLVSGGELTILGKRVNVEVTWTDGRPFGLADEQLLEMIPLPALPESR